MAQKEDSPIVLRITPHPLEFKGVGKVYFRVWIVNVLLTIITLGLYTPWARWRTAHYFYGHTIVAGTPLEFTGQKKRMVKGFLVFFALYVAYELASYTEQETAVNSFMIVGALLAPFLWGSAMRFRLMNTRWRGLRLQFAASWKDIYLASWPVFAVAALWMFVYYVFTEWMPIETSRLGLPRLSAPMLVVLALTLVLTLMCVSRLDYNYRSLLFRHARLGSEHSRWKPRYADFAKIWMGMAALFVVGIMLSSLAVWVALRMISYAWGFILFATVFLIFPASAFLAFCYRKARVFQLVWNNTGISQIARFRCHLKTRSFMWLCLKNLLLTVFTLGFYRPFARVSEYRARLESVTLHVKGDLDRLTSQLLPAQGSGVGDAIADALGLDLIS